MPALDYIIRTRLGAPIYTTDDRRKAVAEAARLRDTYPGCYLVEVVTTERRIWTDRQADAGNVVTLRRPA